MKCSECNFYWKDENDEFPCCHCEGDAPCEDDSYSYDEEEYEEYREYGEYE